MAGGDDSVGACWVNFILYTVEMNIYGDIYKDIARSRMQPDAVEAVPAEERQSGDSYGWDIRREKPVIL